MADRTDLPLLFSGVWVLRVESLTLSICLRCRDGREASDVDLDQRGGRRLSREVTTAFGASEAAKLGMRLRGVHCMSQCKRPCTIALSGDGRFTYLFGDLDPTANAADVLNVAAAYATAEAGFLPRGSRPKVLQAGILARIPPFGFTGDLVEPLPTSFRPTEENDTQ